MFGFLRPGCLAPQTRTKYRQVYAAYCSFQRQRYGAVASAFTSFEAVSLYHLAIETGACETVNCSTPTCCRFRNDWNNHWQIDTEIAEFCAAFAMLLASVKLEDDILDTASPLAAKSIAAKGISRLLRRSFVSAKRRMDKFRPGLVQNVQDLVANHHTLETSKNFDDFDQYAKPTADAFAVVYDAFADLLQQRTGRRINAREIGFHIGRSILLADCLFDLQSDRKRGEFNPIRNKADGRQVRQLALASLSTAGWLSSELSSAEDTLLPAIFKNTFRRVARLDDSNRATRSRFSALSRRGECDCDCGGGDCCCDCGGGGGDVPGEICCNADGDNESCTNRICCSGWSCDALCCEPSDRKKKSPRNLSAKKANPIEIPDPIQVPDTLVGKSATTVGPLNPSGVVSLEGVEHPAKSEGEFIESGVQVEIVKSTSFGLIVQQRM